jgi:hypothetical protein
VIDHAVEAVQRAMETAVSATSHAVSVQDEPATAETTANGRSGRLASTVFATRTVRRAR